METDWYLVIPDNYGNRRRTHRQTYKQDVQRPTNYSDQSKAGADSTVPVGRGNIQAWESRMSDWGWGLVHERGQEKNKETGQNTQPSLETSFGSSYFPGFF